MDDSVVGPSASVPEPQVQLENVQPVNANISGDNKVPPPVPENRTDVHTKFHISKLQFIIPALVVLVAIIVAAFIFQGNGGGLINGNGGGGGDPQASGEPSTTSVLVPATPGPTATAVPRVVRYNHFDPEFSFEYSSEFALSDCGAALRLSRTGSVTAELTNSAICGNTTDSPISLEFSTTDNNPNLSSAPEVVSVETINVGLDKTGEKVVVGTESRVIYVKLKVSDYYYLFILRESAYVSQFSQMLNTFGVAPVDPTGEWEVFDNNTFGYRIKYPPEWTLIADTKGRVGKERFLDKSEIRKNADNAGTQVLVIDSSQGVTNASLTASQIVSSTLNLNAWKRRPVLTYSSVGGELAQILEGQFEDGWQTFTVIWKGTSIFQLSWRDDAAQSTRQTYDWMIGTFEFTK